MAPNTQAHVPPRTTLVAWPPAWLTSPLPCASERRVSADPIELAADHVPEPVDEASQPLPTTSVSSAGCRRCGSTGWRDVPIHNGRSTRRDCAGCGRFIDFPVWHGRSANLRFLDCEATVA